MPIAVKICGLNTPDAVAAAVSAGADYVGFVFYPPSPRAVTPEVAAELAHGIPAGIVKVGLFVDADDALLGATLTACPLDMVQLHGRETPERVLAVAGRFAIRTMKAMRIADADDVARAEPYEAAADMLLFDAKPPANRAGALPGGNGLSFDWRLIAGRRRERPWMLSGGLDAGNVAEAVAVTGAPAVDVSSGVEVRPGVKDPRAIAAFVAAAKGIQNP